jgi:multidrug efflux pump subunit AcrB
MLLIWITGNTVNIQSFMGSIMAIGVAVSNSILLVSNAESIQGLPENTDSPGALAASNRFRPIVMTTLAMIAGMVPMAMGIGEGGKQIAPLGIAVIGGLLFSTIISLWFVPLVYDLVFGRRKPIHASLDPTDLNSTYYDKNI